MSSSLLRLVACAGAFTAALFVFASTSFAAGDRITVVRGGSTSPQAGPQGSDTAPRGEVELRGPKRLGTSPLRLSPGSAGPLLPGKSGGPTVSAGKKAKSNPQLLADWHGLDHRASRLAFGGNQFSGEPPDQGLCVGNGVVMETVNQVIRFYDTVGNPLSGNISLNEFTISRRPSTA